MMEGFLASDKGYALCANGKPGWGHYSKCPSVTLGKYSRLEGCRAMPAGFGEGLRQRQRHGEVLAAGVIMLN